MGVADDVFKFLDLRVILDKKSKPISVEMFCKAVNTFMCVLPSSCLKKNNIENISKGIAIRLRRIFYSGGKFDKCKSEYQKYSIARDNKPSKMRK